MGNESLGPPGYLPHYLLRGDPFASRLSPLADIMAALYIGIIGSDSYEDLMEARLALIQLQSSGLWQRDGVLASHILC
ncbi:unnamed protein product [Arctogadus glacialis]